MSNKTTARQREILGLLINNKAGLSIDEIANKLSISRNAVQQHISILEREDYIQTGGLKKTAGRPVRTFILTATGLNHFPKQYAWFSELILTELKNEMGSAGLTIFLQKLGNTLVQSLLPRFEGKSPKERVVELSSIMDDLGFKVTASLDSTTGDQYINACNCIYHDIAQKHHEVCELDKTLISTLLNQEVELVECMAEGQHICSFRTQNSKKK